MTTGRGADIPALSRLFTMYLFESQIPQSTAEAAQLREAIRTVRLGLARDALAEAAARSGLPVEDLMEATLRLDSQQSLNLLIAAKDYEQEQDTQKRLRSRAMMLSLVADTIGGEGLVEREAVHRFFNGEEVSRPSWADAGNVLGSTVVICIAALASAGVAPLGALAAGALGAGAPVALTATVETAVTAVTGGVITALLTAAIERAAASRLPATPVAPEPPATPEPSATPEPPVTGRRRRPLQIRTTQVGPAPNESAGRLPGSASDSTSPSPDLEQDLPDNLLASRERSDHSLDRW